MQTTHESQTPSQALAWAPLSCCACLRNKESRFPCVPVPADATKWASQLLGPWSEKLYCCAFLPQCPKETVVVVASYPRKLQGSKRWALGCSSLLSTAEQYCRLGGGQVDARCQGRTARQRTGEGTLSEITAACSHPQTAGDGKRGNAQLARSTTTQQVASAASRRKHSTEEGQGAGVVARSLDGV